MTAVNVGAESLISLCSGELMKFGSFYAFDLHLNTQVTVKLVPGCVLSSFNDRTVILIFKLCLLVYNTEHCLHFSNKLNLRAAMGKVPWYVCIVHVTKLIIMSVLMLSKYEHKVYT